MAQAYSLDLRRRVTQAIAAGKSRRAAAKQFEVSAATAVRLQQRLERTGSLEPSRRGRPRGSGKLAPHREAILAKVDAQPDITMPDLAAWLYDERGVSVDPSNLSKLLRKAGLSYKKNTHGRGERTRRDPTGAR